MADTADKESLAKDKVEKETPEATIEENVRRVGSNSGGSRPMKFPYTFTAKLVQFPWKFYFSKNWVYKYYLFGILCSIPIFYKFTILANSPGNKEKFAEIKRKDDEEFEHKWEE